MGRSGRSITWLLVAALLAIAGFWLVTSGSRVLSGDLVRRSISGFLTGGQRPPPGADAAEHRIMPIVRPAADGGEYRFLRMSDGAPVRYSPCRRLAVVVNPRNAPVDALPQVESAVAAIRDATGLMITVEGQTRERYSSDRSPYQPDRYGERWAPILVSWAGRDAVPEFAGDAVGFGGSFSVDPLTGPASYVTGSVVLDREFFADPANHDYLHEAVVHELGHVVGLDHVEDSAQVMWSGGLHGSGLGGGDRIGLARLGRGPCTPEL
ncbi:MAG: hypothetical protein U0R64_02060 [Candidatus Nanopelagicales bacterium]